MRKVLCLMLIAIMLLSVGCSAAVSVVGANINDDGNLILSMSDGSTIDAGYAKGDKGDQGEKGIDGKDGSDGIDGVDGVGIKKAAVNDSGHLMIRLTDDTLMDTGYVIGADGKDGRDGVDGRDGRDGTDGRDGFDGTNGKDGVDGKTPYIGDNGNWWIGEEDTGVEAESTDFIYSDKGEGTILVAYVGNDYDVVIPEKTTRIGNGAFAGNKVINTVKIPQNVTSIGNSAFENCINLCTISLPNNLLSIGDSAFAGCTQLEGTSDKGFSELLALPEGLIRLGDSAFADCRGLYSVYIPFSLVTSDGWGKSTFEHCTFLHSITWETATDANKTGDIPSYTFYECSTLDVDSLPNYIDNVFNYAFAYTGISGKLELTSSIREYSFSHCDKITDITLTMYDGELRTGVFLGCYNLKKVEFIIPDVVQGGTYSNSSFSFAIWEKAFEGCQNLETVIFPETATVVYEGQTYNVRWYIFSRAFSTTGFSEFTLPANIGWIEAGILDWCDNLKSVYIEATTPPFILSDGINLFETCSNLEAIYVPAASVDAYKAADGWKDYADKIQAIS